VKKNRKKSDILLKKHLTFSIKWSIMITMKNGGVGITAAGFKLLELSSINSRTFL
jgi:hypothetical protein